ncbi:NAD(P)H-hydrate epimerase [Thermolongibacillus altinsuensis]|uniref:Bifunctional NAD(P)H-hydrate repair enzyme n=1 Tax=Thermolongibacillus altinsuensis TaxID=575256 RepID=A0A4V2QA54_9BACL|nr:NAD(P)H-hydrate dehydratase [Thermolongibacillus altinsuensis]TCL48386.1 NAD(P)H-hydrate epimerase [Thermolongibacillus altinsuensis]
MRIVTASEMYAIDRDTIERIGMSEESLMENAGQAVARALLERLHPSMRIAVLAGTGNNGGDGFVVARMLKSYGYCTDVWLIPPKEKVKGAAKKALDIYENAGYEVKLYSGNEQTFVEQIAHYDVIVDALLGIGVQGAVRSPYKEIIDMVNRTNASVYAIDVPSGIPADGGAADTAVRADVTITIQCPKLSAYTFPTADYYGELVVVDIGIPPLSVARNAEFRSTWEEADVVRTLPKRQKSSHKGTYGKALVIGGSKRMTGAVTFTAKAALRSGAGLLTMAIPEAIYSVVANRIPEAMYYPCSSHDGYFSGEIDLSHLDVDAIAVGPGIGRTEGTKNVVKTVLSHDVPVVLDADALFFWNEYAPFVRKRSAATIVTPHPGEMARMLGVSIREVENDRFGVAKRLAMEYGIYVVLKGPYTIVTTPDGMQYVNTTGNPALAKGGSGDVLTGMIVAFLMQHRSIQEAISNAVWIHGKAADFLVEKGHSQLDVLATDVIEEIPNVLFHLTTTKSAEVF